MAREPMQVIEAWAAAFNAGDLDGLAGLYEDGAVLATGRAGESVVGVGAILDFWRPLSGATITVLARSAFGSGDVALTQNRCRVDVPGGEPVVGAGVEVVRRQPDGSWRYAVCNPHGDAVLG